MAERKYYCFCDSNCKFETMSKEQILAAIAEATGNTVSGVDDGFITKIRETNANIGLKFWRGTMSQFNALSTKDENTFYIITDDTSIENINREIESLHETDESNYRYLSASVETVRQENSETRQLLDDMDTHLSEGYFIVDKAHTVVPNIVFNEESTGVDVSVYGTGLYAVKFYTDDAKTKVATSLISVTYPDNVYIVEHGTIVRGVNAAGQTSDDYFITYSCGQVITAVNNSEVGKGKECTIFAVYKIATY